MKFSVKLLTALAAIALLVVALAGATGSLSVRANPGVDGAIFLENKWSGLTTDSSDADYVGSGKTLYSTFVEENSSGVAQQTIETDADVLIVTVKDADLDVLVDKTATSTVTITGVNQTQVIVLPLADSPIVDVDGDGQLTDDVTLSGVTNLTISNVAPGDGTSLAAAITLVGTGVPVGNPVTIGWKTSATDSVLVKVTTTQDTNSADVRLDETGRSTGVFKGELRLLDKEDPTNVSNTGATSTVSTAATTTRLIINGGTVTATYVDTDNTGTGDKTFTATASAETNAPTITVAAPANNTATQDRTPVFNGTITDSGAGLKVNRTFIFIDESDDPTNTTAVSVDPSSATDRNSPDTGTAADGTISLSWDFTPSVALPKDFTTGTPDHKVDWQVRSSDLAGNVGFSDSDDTVANTLGRGQVNIVRIDQKLPSIIAAYTGQYWDASADPEVRKFNDVNRLEIAFDGDLDGTSIDNTDFEVEFDSGTTHVPTVAEVDDSVPSSVFLTLGADIPADDTPTVRIVGQIADSAGNTTNSGSKVAVDSLAPGVTVALSGGSATSDPSGLTKDNMTITITSDEDLSSLVVQIYDEDDATTPETTVTAIAQGGNVWVATAKGTALATSRQAGDKKSVVVMATDTASSASQGGSAVAPSTRTVGNADVANSSAIVYKLDESKPTLAVTPSVDTKDPRPFVTLDFGEAVAIDLATFDGADISASLATTDSKKYIYKPSSDLALGTHTVVAKATDTAGNISGEITKTFDVKEKKSFSLPLLPGWNFVSLPAAPIDSSINSVVTSADISTVVAYDATTGTFTSAVRDTESGTLMGGLTTFDASTAYWVLTTSFDPIVVELTEPQGAQLPPEIAVVAGWNAVPVLDTSGASSVGDTTAGPHGGTGDTLADNAGTYFGAKVGRVYAYDTLTGKFTVVPSTASVYIGAGYWAFYSAADTILP